MNYSLVSLGHSILLIQLKIPIAHRLIRVVSHNLINPAPDMGNSTKSRNFHPTGPAPIKCGSTTDNSDENVLVSKPVGQWAPTVSLIIIRSNKCYSRCLWPSIVLEIPCSPIWHGYPC